MPLHVGMLETGPFSQSAFGGSSCWNPEGTRIQVRENAPERDLVGKADSSVCAVVSCALLHWLDVRGIKIVGCFSIKLAQP